MKKTLLAVTISLSLFGLTACDSENTSKEHIPLELTVAHINDTHAHLDPTENGLAIQPTGQQKFEFFAKLGGYPRLKFKLDELREQAGKDGRHFLTLFGGDAFQGTLYFTQFRGEEESRLLSEMGIDAATLGNHEFDLGNGPLNEYAAKVNYPIVAANLVKSSSSALKDNQNIHEYIIKEINGESVGIFGLVLDNMHDISSPDKDTQFQPMIASAQRTVDTLKKKGANKIIMVTHIGLQSDQAVAKAVNGIDLIVGGHSQTFLGDMDELKSIGYTAHNQNPSDDNTYAQMVTNPDGGKTCIVQAGEWAKGYGLVNVSLSKEGAITKCEGRNTLMSGDDFTKSVPDPKDSKKTIKVPLGGSEQTNVVDYIAKSPVIEIVPEDQTMRDVIDTEYKPAVAALEAKVIADVPVKLPHVRVPTTPDGAGLIDSLVAESLYWKLNQLNTKVDFTIQNAGGVRADVNATPLTVGYVMGTLLPFGNKIAAFNLKGKDVRATLEYAVDYAIGHQTGIAASSGAFPYVGHLSYTYDGKLAKGSRITKLEVLDANGQWAPLDDEKIYRVGSNTYIAAGKDGYNGLLKREELPNKGDYVDTGVGENEMFMEYAEARGTLTALPYPTVTYYKP
ncbi:5'-nucleotidase C-terminal domain-containing protein [Aeromonas veronii]|uniref:bifunctional metallophosphatase/5'-nucleotidase n=1 Tax=Aeromonas veronii TaxID=654 RepID=UPI001FD1809D|nr:5'-nucleotidase C-terminal domain-containing protein [Aeromonas veronii]MCJ7975693.1 5'-nucleotidase C-terminal domain-containing protein [Aeromonas veronii]UOR18267.1 5'-nucleotidase C-terminal domain-containing protein [Aeromonas veronii]